MFITHAAWAATHSLWRFYLHSWMLLREELLMAEDSPHVTMQRMPTFHCSLSAVAGVSV